MGTQIPNDSQAVHAFAKYLRSVRSKAKGKSNGILHICFGYRVQERNIRDCKQIYISPQRDVLIEIFNKMLEVSLMRKPRSFLLFRFIHDFLMLRSVGKMTGIQIAAGAVSLCEFIGVHSLYSNLDALQVLEQNVPQFMIEVIYVHNVLKSRSWIEHIMRTERQRIATDAIVVIPEKEVFRLLVIRN